MPTAYFSLESSELEIKERLKASITSRLESVPCKVITPPVDVIDAMEKVGFRFGKGRDMEQEARQMMEEVPVWIEHDLSVGMDEIVSRMEQLHQDNQVRIVIIDGLQLILSAYKTEQVQTLQKLYRAADKLRMAVILTSGPNLSLEMRGGSKRPYLSDLRDWYQLECFSSMVMFVYRPEHYYIDTFEDNSPSKDMADIMVEKNTFGGTGDVRMHFDHYVSFRELSTIKK